MLFLYLCFVCILLHTTFLMVLLAGYAVDMMQKCSVYISFAYELISCLQLMKYIQQYALGEAVLKTHLYYTDWTIFNAACSFNFECMLRMLSVLH